jgi:peptide chain release factor 2
MKVLKSRLFALEKQKKDEELNKLKGITSGIDFGTQIRSYVLTPYTLVKDYRSDFEMVNVDDVLDGDLEEIIESILKSGAVK